MRKHVPFEYITAPSLHNVLKIIHSFLGLPDSRYFTGLAGILLLI